jgi:serine O-acetyltransferase
MKIFDGFLTIKDFHYSKFFACGFKVYHEVVLPESFFFEHPIGLVLGRAKYGNRFFAMQNCTVGGNKGKYPIIGNNVKLYSGAKIIGNCVIGNNVSVAANTYKRYGYTG